MSTTNTPKIAIVGGGPGGLIAARILSNHHQDVTVFEREGAFTDRSQGGSLDMHADAGQLALGKAELFEAFQKVARYGDQESRIYDKHGVLHFMDAESAEKDRPEIDRGDLRSLLLASLPSAVMRWGSPVTAIVEGTDGRWRIQFATGACEEFDIVVGADGTWSKVRPALSKAVPRYTGILMIEFGIENVEQRFPQVSHMTGRGLTFALGDSKALLAHRDANEHMGGYVGLRVPDTWFHDKNLDQLSADAALHELCAAFDGWSQELLDWIRRSDEPLVPRPIYELPVGHSWEHRRGLTLLGDAAHVMSPFGGDGANLAMLDGADLAEAILGDDWDAGLLAYERKIAERSSEPARSAGKMIQDVFSPTGLESSLQWPHVQGVHGPESATGATGGGHD